MNHSAPNEKEHQSRRTRARVNRTLASIAAAFGALSLIASCRVARDAASQPPMTAESWSAEGLTGRRMTTTHFDLISTLRDDALEKALPTFLEAAYRRYEQTLPAPPGERARLSTYVFGSRDEWVRFARRRFASRFDIYSRIRAGGFSEGDTSVSFYSDRATTLATLAHEGWHQYVGSRFGAQLPAWLNEGFACYHEAVDLAGDTPRFTPLHNTFRINALRDGLQQQRLMPLRQLVGTDAGKAIGHDRASVAQIYYAQAWALVVFLRHGAGPQVAAGFDRLLRDVAEGTFSIHVSAARLADPSDQIESPGEACLRAYFGRSPDKLEVDYRDYVRKLAGFVPVEP